MIYIIQCLGMITTSFILGFILGIKEEEREDPSLKQLRKGDIRTLIYRDGDEDADGTYQAVELVWTGSMWEVKGKLDSAEICKKDSMLRYVD